MAKVILGDISIDHQQDIDYVSEHMTAVIMGPGCGEGSLSIRSIEEICKTLPNLEWVGIPVSWFIDSLDISSAKIKPGSEKRSDEIKEDSWLVSSYDRNNAHAIARKNSYDPSTIRYGGTMPDEEVLKFVNALKEQGKKVAFYPFLMVDNENKDWRGYITGSAEQVEMFYTNQYQPFVMHYAFLLRDKVDMFYIGSELEGLTVIKGEERNFPFVNNLCELAANVRSIVGEKVQISYAANWSEYLHCKGGYRPLDTLWSDQNINFVGIDYYMPLTDIDTQQITLESIKNGFTSSEGWDYFYQDSTQIIIDQDYNRWKNIGYWQSSDHWAWDSEEGESYKTSWIPNSKPIIFSEFGFRSIDMATNTPNIYGSSLPKHSNGSTDFPLQIKAIRATLEHISENPAIQTGFCYVWDARGYGWQNSYVDGHQWAQGHWIDGKLKILQTK